MSLPIAEAMTRALRQSLPPPLSLAASCTARRCFLFFSFRLSVSVFDEVRFIQMGLIVWEVEVSQSTMRQIHRLHRILP